MRWLIYFLAFNCIYFMPFTALGFSSTIQPESVKSPNDMSDKYIYVDLSLNDVFSSEGANPIFRYFNGSTHDVNLIKNDSYVFCTGESIPLSVFLNEEFYFEILCFNGSEIDYSTGCIFEETPLQLNNYNYVCLWHHIHDEKTHIRGYGFMGERMEKMKSSYETHRIWLNDDYSFFEDDWGVECTNTIGFYRNGEWNVVEMSTVVNSFDSKKYHYVDLPIDVTTINFMVSSQKEGHSYLVYHVFCVDQVASGFCYFITGEIDNALTIKIGTVLNCDALLLSHVLESYLTFGTNELNGSTYRTVRALFLTWMKEKKASETDMREQYILDYSNYSKNGNSYQGLEKDTPCTLNEKWAAMCKNANINPNTGRAVSSVFQTLDISDALFYIYITSIDFAVAFLISSSLLFLKIKTNKQ